jgi:hypothetical protein
MFPTFVFENAKSKNKTKQTIKPTKLELPMQSLFITQCHGGMRGLLF